MFNIVFVHVDVEKDKYLICRVFDVVLNIVNSLILTICYVLKN